MTPNISWPTDPRLGGVRSVSNSWQPGPKALKAASPTIPRREWTALTRGDDAAGHARADVCWSGWLEDRLLSIADRLSSVPNLTAFESLRRCRITASLSTDHLAKGAPCLRRAPPTPLRSSSPRGRALG